MPIQGLTTRAASFVELGIIRKGGAKTEANKPGLDLDYFRFVTADQEAAAAFKEALTDKPRAIEFVLPFESLEENFEAWREAYVASGLAHRCDGVTCVAWRDTNGKIQMSEKPCPTPTDDQRKNGGCKQVARLKIIIPALKRFAYITVTTTSIYDIMTMYQNLLAVQLANADEGGLRGVPLILRRREKEISTPDKDGKRARRKKWLLSIEPSQAWVEKKLLQQRNAALGLIEATKAPLMIEQGTPIEEDEENDEIHEGVVEPPTVATSEGGKKIMELLAKLKMPDDEFVQLIETECGLTANTPAEAADGITVEEQRIIYGKLSAKTKEKK